MPPLYVPSALWLRTWYGLRKRSHGQSESAAVWSGTRDEAGERALDVVFLDDLPGVRGQALQHCVPRTASTALLRELRDRGHVIVGDVHTHPSGWVDLSETDQAHPIEYRVGLLAVVLPHFALGEPRLAGVGIHIYRGSGTWETPNGPAREAILVVTREGG